MGLVPSNYLDIVEPLPNYVDEDESSEVSSSHSPTHTALDTHFIEMQTQDEWEDDIGKIPCYYKGRKL